jgi:hypothetical protein
MPITITVGSDTPEAPEPEKVEHLPLKMKLDMRKAVDGSLMIFDHPEIDIVVVPTTSKVVTFPKKTYNDEVYNAQDRLFSHLFKAGVITPGTVEGGNVHGAMGAVILPPTNPKFPVADLVVLSVGKFIEKEKPDYLFAKAYEKEVDEMYVDPPSEDSTPLGKVPQAVKKGSIQPYDTRRYLAGYS